MYEESYWHYPVFQQLKDSGGQKREPVHGNLHSLVGDWPAVVVAKEVDA